MVAGWEAGAREEGEGEGKATREEREEDSGALVGLAVRGEDSGTLVGLAVSEVALAVGEVEMGAVGVMGVMEVLVGVEVGAMVVRAGKVAEEEAAQRLQPQESSRQHKAQGAYHANARTCL